MMKGTQKCSSSDADSDSDTDQSSSSAGSDSNLGDQLEEGNVMKTGSRPLYSLREALEQN